MIKEIRKTYASGYLALFVLPVLFIANGYGEYVNCPPIPEYTQVSQWYVFNENPVRCKWTT